MLIIMALGVKVCFVVRPQSVTLSEAATLHLQLEDQPDWSEHSNAIGIETTSDDIIAVDDNVNFQSATALVDMEAHWEGYNSDETDEEECEVRGNEEDDADIGAARNAFAMNARRQRPLCLDSLDSHLLKALHSVSSISISRYYHHKGVQRKDVSWPSGQDEVVNLRVCIIFIVLYCKYTVLLLNLVVLLITNYHISRIFTSAIRILYY
jgi:hypothetical protein